MIYGMMNAPRMTINNNYICGKFSMISRMSLMIRIDDTDEKTK
jgi:hypothetical protein